MATRSEPCHERGEVRATRLQGDISGPVCQRAQGASRANLKGSRLLFARLEEADLSYTSLSGANLEQAYLENAALVEVDLRSASLREAELTRALLTGSDLRQADVGNADLRGANLESTTLSLDTNFTGAKYTDDRSPTRWPDGFDPEAAGCLRDPWTDEEYFGEWAKMRQFPVEHLAEMWKAAGRGHDEG